MHMTTNSSAFLRGLGTSSRRVERRVETILKQVTKRLHETIEKRTPVWSGQAVRNMVWTMGVPNTTEFGAIPGPTGTPGTNDMPLGPEPRRAANREAAAATQKALRFKRPWGTYHLSNNAPHIALLETGMLPTKEKTRSAEGMFFVSFHYVVAMLKAGAI